MNQQNLTFDQYGYLIPSEPTPTALAKFERPNKHIAWHQSLEEPSKLSIGEFSDLRDNYIDQVRLLMSHYRLEVKSLPTTPNARQQAA